MGLIQANRMNFFEGRNYFSCRRKSMRWAQKRFVQDRLSFQGHLLKKEEAVIFVREILCLPLVMRRCSTAHLAKVLLEFRDNIICVTSIEKALSVTRLSLPLVLEAKDLLIEKTKTTL